MPHIYIEFENAWANEKLVLKDKFITIEDLLKHGMFTNRNIGINEISSLQIRNQNEQEPSSKVDNPKLDNVIEIEEGMIISVNTTAVQPTSILQRFSYMLSNLCSKCCPSKDSAQEVTYQEELSYHLLAEHSTNSKASTDQNGAKGLSTDTLPSFINGLEKINLDEVTKYEGVEKIGGLSLN